MNFSGVERQVGWGSSLNGEELQSGKCFRHLGVDIAADVILRLEVSQSGGRSKFFGNIEKRGNRECYTGRQKWVCVKE